MLSVLVSVVVEWSGTAVTTHLHLDVGREPAKANSGFVLGVPLGQHTPPSPQKVHVLSEARSQSLIIWCSIEMRYFVSCALFGLRTNTTSEEKSRGLCASMVKAPEKLLRPYVCLPPQKWGLVFWSCGVGCGLAGDQIFWMGEDSLCCESGASSRGGAFLGAGVLLRPCRGPSVGA